MVLVYAVYRHSVAGHSVQGLWWFLFRGVSYKNLAIAFAERAAQRKRYLLI